MRHAGLLVLSMLTVTLAVGQDLAAGAQQGLTAPPFSARPVNGGQGSLAALIKDNGAVVALVDPRSEEGKRALAFLQQSGQRLRDMKVGAIAFVINMGQASTVEKLVRDNGLTIPVVHDEGNKIADAYGVSGSAAVVVVDPEQKIFQRYDATETQPNIGPLAMGGVRDMLAEIEAAKAEQAGEGTPGEGDAAAPGGQAPAAADAAGTGKAPLPPPNDDETRRRIRLGWALIQQGQVDTALADARALAQSRGAEPLSMLWLAYALEASGNFAESAVTYRKLLKLQPANDYARTAVMRIDPDGHWLSEADLPKMLPPGPPPSQPLPAESANGANGASAVNTTSQGEASIGE